MSQGRSLNTVLSRQTSAGDKHVPLLHKFDTLSRKNIKENRQNHHQKDVVFTSLPGNEVRYETQKSSATYIALNLHFESCAPLNS